MKMCCASRPTRIAKGIRTVPNARRPYRCDCYAPNHRFGSSLKARSAPKTGVPIALQTTGR